MRAPRVSDSEIDAIFEDVWRRFQEACDRHLVVLNSVSIRPDKISRPTLRFLIRFFYFAALDIQRVRSYTQSRTICSFHADSPGCPWLPLAPPLLPIHS